MLRASIPKSDELLLLKDAFLAISSRHSLAEFLGISYNKHLAFYLYRCPSNIKYKSFEIAKKSGGKRSIYEPRSGLKLIQKQIASALLSVLPSSSVVHGYCSGRSIITNAAVHVRPKLLLNIDLQDFFPSINFGRVRGLFLRWPFNFSDEVAVALAQLCCHENALPAGAPTSPIVSNLICARMDRQLKQLAANNHCLYSRYADDLTFSTRNRLFETSILIETKREDRQDFVLGDDLVGCIHVNGFRVNPDKTRVRSRQVRQEVTGLVVNKKVNVDRRYIRQIRAMLHAAEKFGLENAENTYYANHDKRTFRPGRIRPSFANILGGKISFVGSVRGRGDGLYTKLFSAYETVIGHRKFNDVEARLHATTWVIEDEHDIIQGTAFMLKDVGIVTCAHCVGESPYMYQASKPAERIALRIVWRNDVIDLALLHADELDVSVRGFEMSRYFDKAGAGDPVRLVGFPSFAPGKTISIKDGQITSKSVKHGQPRLHISCSIIAGNSGGPLLDARGKVLGIAVTGADSLSGAEETDEHAAIPVHVLKQALISNDIQKASE